VYLEAGVWSVPAFIVRRKDGDGDVVSASIHRTTEGWR